MVIEYIIVNQLELETKFVYTNCDGNEIFSSVNGGGTVYVCSATTPTGPSYLQISDTGLVCG